MKKTTESRAPEPLLLTVVSLDHRPPVLEDRALLLVDGKTFRYDAFYRRWVQAWVNAEEADAIREKQSNQHSGPRLP
jgi:hypothetical protein